MNWKELQEKIITKEVKYAASLYVTGGDTFLSSHQAEIVRSGMGESCI